MTLHRSRSGFTLLEMIVAMVVIALLVGVIALRSGNVVDRGKVTKLVDTVQSLKQAAAIHQFDASRFAREFGSDPATTNHELSLTQTYAGWKGPYLERPLTTGDNPWAAAINIYPTLTSAGNPGFDLDGNGTAELTGNGNLLTVANVPQAQAQDVDSTLDKGIPGTWSDTGSVRYRAANTTLYILLCR